MVDSSHVAHVAFAAAPAGAKALPRFGMTRLRVHPRRTVTQFLPKPLSRQRCRPQHARNGPTMFTDPWSVSQSTIDFAAAQLFAASLFPYLAFLRFLSLPRVGCPPLAQVGFRFLLVFVFATIPAGIYAKTHYHDILANVDLLHGTAESLLTITNLLVVLGFRRAMPDRTTTASSSPSAVRSTLLPLLAMLPALALHAEPANALSFPTWIIHVSSLVEWLVAMGLVWTYADVTCNQRWKGLTWGMLPLHASGICACTYHLFYNAPAVSILVPIQAFLTLFGNATMAIATFRISRAPGDDAQDTKTGELAMSSPASAGSSPPAEPLRGFEDLADLGDSDLTFLAKVFFISAIGSFAVKWGELLFDQPFHPQLPLALAFVTVPTALNVLKWTLRSRSTDRNFEEQM